MKKIINKKLRDLTRAEAENIRNDSSLCMLIDEGDCTFCEFKYVHCNSSNPNWWFDNKNVFTDDFLNQEIGITINTILTCDEDTILKNIDKKYKYIVRDIFGDLMISETKPVKRLGERYWYNENGYFTFLEFYNDLFKFITFEDEEPYSIEDLLNGSYEK